MNDRDLHYLLLLGHQRTNKRISAQTRKEGLMPGQPKILEFLLEHNACNQKEIALGCALDKSTVTSLLSRMAEEGLITRATPSEDRRRALVCLTEKGRRCAVRVRDICAQVDALAWRDIPEQEREVFLQVFRRLLANLEEPSAQKESAETQ